MTDKEFARLSELIKNAYTYLSTHQLVTLAEQLKLIQYLISDIYVGIKEAEE